jgi:hypothetical protein
MVSASSTAKAACLVLGCLALLSPPCRAKSQFLQRDYSHETLHLESFKAVTTWEEEGVRVFAAPHGAVLRQGPARLAAPFMVVWFDRARSARADVQAAVVTVYAEGDFEGARRPVRLVEGRRVRTCAAVYMRFTSLMAFAWDAPLRETEEPAPAWLMHRVEEMTSGLQEETIWEELPSAAPEERLESVMRLLEAEQTEVFWNEDPVVVVYIGDVHGGYGSLQLRADTAVLWYDTERDTFEAYARGNVRVYKDPEATPLTAPVGEPALEDVLEFLRADELYINPQAGRGLATAPELRAKDPRTPFETVYVFRGEEAFLVNSRTLTIREVSVSTCEFAHPHYQFAAERAQLVRQRPSTLLTAWDVRFQVGRSERTLLWVPFFGTDLTARAYLLSDYAFGSSSKFGTFLQTTWQPLDLTTTPDWIDEWTVNLDYYSDRGPGVGSTLLYEFGPAPAPHHRGRVRGYHVSDSGSVDDNDLPVPRQSRGRFHVEHRSQLTRDWRVDAEYYWLSDSQFLNEYFEADFEEEKTPESYLLVRYLRDSTYLALLYKQQVNDFLTQLEETPSAELELIGVPLGPLVYDGTLRAGYYDLEFNDELVPQPPDPPSLYRLHTEHMLSMPFNVGIFRLNPFVEALASHASDSAMAGGSFQGSESRAGFGGGITASTTLARSFGLTSDLFDLHRLRHVVIPHAGARVLSVSGDSEDLIQMDAIDQIDSGSEFTFGVRQRLDTKRLKGERLRPVTWAELDVALVSRSSDSVNPALDEDFIRADFDWYVSEHVTLFSRDNRIALEDQPDVLNLGFELDYLPKWACRLRWNRITDRNSTVTADLDYALSDRYRLLLMQQYDFDSRGTGESQHLETSVTLRRLLHEWILDVGLHIEKANDEVAIIFGFGPKGWGAFDPGRAARY